MKPNPDDFFRQVTLRICGNLEIQKALADTFNYISEFIPLDEIILMYPEIDQRRMRLAARADYQGGRTSDLIFSLSEQAVTLIRDDRLPPLMIINDPIHHPVAQNAKMIASADSSVILVRLVLSGVLVGAVAFRADGAGKYSNVEAQLLEPLREPLAISLSNSRQYKQVVRLKERLAEDNRDLRADLQPPPGQPIIGADYGLKGVMELVNQVADLDSPVLLLGETGTGKGLIAGAIHQMSSRRNGPFVKVDCGAIPGTLIDSELFGHERGAFTGAAARKRGRFERAHNGTIFLDEVGELPLEAQVRLLRVLQDKQIERVGGTQSINLDLRVIAATNRRLADMTSKGAFRQDLYFRLNVFPIILPPLVQRKGDIPALVHYFIQKKARELGLEFPPVLAPGALNRLRDYSWPGNVRELENAVERALIRSRGTPLAFDDINRPAQSLVREAEDLEIDTRSLDEVVARHIHQVLRQTNGRVGGQAGAARILGLHPSTLRAKMRKLSIPFGRSVKY